MGTDERSFTYDDCGEYKAFAGLFSSRTVSLTLLSNALCNLGSILRSTFELPGFFVPSRFVGNDFHAWPTTIAVRFICSVDVDVRAFAGRPAGS